MALRLVRPILAVDGCVKSRTKVMKDKDGRQRGNGAGGLVIRRPHEEDIEECAAWKVPVSNIESELKALIWGLTYCWRAGISPLHVIGDSQVSLRMVFGHYRVNAMHLVAPVMLGKKLVARWGDNITWEWVPREHPLVARADQMANIGYEVGRKCKLRWRRRHNPQRQASLNQVKLRLVHGRSKSVRVKS